MPAGTYNLFIEQGTTYQVSFQWKDASNNPVDLTGYKSRMEARATLASPDVVFHAETTNAGFPEGVGSGNGYLTIPSPTNGTIILLLSATVTSAIIILSGVYDLEVEDSTGRVTRLLQGTFTVSPEVTRP